MTIGIEQFRNLREQRLDHMLTQPFRGGVEDLSRPPRDGQLRLCRDARNVRSNVRAPDATAEACLAVASCN